MVLTRKRAARLRAGVLAGRSISEQYPIGFVMPHDTGDGLFDRACGRTFMALQRRIALDAARRSMRLIEEMPSALRTPKDDALHREMDCLIRFGLT